MPCEAGGIGTNVPGLFKAKVMVLGNHPKGPGFKSQSDYQSMTKFRTLLCCSAPV